MKINMRNSRLRLSRILPVIFLLSLVVGCAGGGTIGTGLTPTGFGGHKQSSGISFVLVGTVVNKTNSPISQALVTIETSFGVLSRRTDAYGRFRAPLRITSGEYISVEVEHQNSRYSQKQQISPAGANEVIQTIRIEGDGSLELN